MDVARDRVVGWSDPDFGECRALWTNVDQDGRDGEGELAKKLYVGNLPFSVTEADLRQLFEEYGTVESVNVITDRDTGRPRGFAFVEMDDAGNADKAIQGLDGQDFGGRDIRVNEAKERSSGPRGGGGGGGGGGRRRY